MQRLVAEISWATGAQVLNVVIALGTLKVWAEYLPPQELGRMALVITSASMFTGIVFEPLGRAALLKYTHFADIGEKAQFVAAAASTFAMITALALLSLVGLSFITATFGPISWTTPFFLAGFFTMDNIRFFSQTILTCERDQKAIATITIIDTGLRATLLWITLATLGGRSNVALAGNLAGATASAMFSVFSCRRHLVGLTSAPILLDVRARQRRQLIFRYALPLAPANLLSHLAEAASRYIIAVSLGLHHAGLFVAIYGMVRRPFGMLSDIGRSVLMPAYIEARTRNRVSAARRIRFLWIMIIISGSAFGTLFFHLFRGEFVELLLSPSYASAAPYLLSTAASMSILNANTVLSGILLSHGDTRSLLVGNGIATAAIIALTSILGSTLGFHGAILAMGLGYFAQFSYLLARSLRSREWAGRSAT
jgi:O-antigen/teichoic acid export membrane protein